MTTTTSSRWSWWFYLAGRAHLRRGAAGPDLSWFYGASAGLSSRMALWAAYRSAWTPRGTDGHV
jgi:hypothetical protein